MRIFKDTPFEFGLMPWEHEPPTPIALVFVKGTFDIVPGGECEIAAEQQTISGEVLYDDVEIPSAQCESDFALYKPRGEYLLRGSACASHGDAATIVPVSAKVGPLEKTVAVYGDRKWVSGVLGAKPSDPEPFTSIPLRWERAFGGPRHSKNPAGQGTATVRVDDVSFDPLPNIEDPKNIIVSKESSPEPAGFGAIPSTWSQRASLVGTYDEEWKRSRWPYLPRDFDFAFFQSAPPDQRLERGFWRGDEPIWLRGLHPERVNVETKLPGLRARCFVEWTTRSPESDEPVEEPTTQVALEDFHRFMEEHGGAPAAAPEPAEPPPALEEEPTVRPTIPVPTLGEVILTLDTITIDGDAQQVTCVWRGMLQGISDARLSNVERLFFVHEPLDAAQPHRHYEEWLHRLLLDDAREDAALEADDPAEPEEEEETPPEVAPRLPSGDERAQAAMDQMYAAMGGLLDLERFVRPTITEVRASFEEAGLAPPEELVEPEPPAVVLLDELPRSALRLGAIIRRKLGRPFAGYDWTGAPFAGLDLSGVDMAGAILRDAELSGAKLEGADLSAAVLYGARLDRASLAGANLSGAELSNADLELAELRGATLTSAHGATVNLRGAHLEGVRAERLELLGSDLSSARFAGAVLDGADFSGSRLDGADFQGASLIDASIERSSARNVNFERCCATDLRASGGVDLTDANLVLMEAGQAQFQGANGLRANFSGSNLAGADFSDSRLLKSNFVRCDLSGACFGFADLRLAQLMLANAFEADFDQANLEESDLRSAHLFSASLYRTRLDGAKLDGADLTRTYLDRA